MKIKMFCPKCGAAEQEIEAFCRDCGFFIPDFEKVSRETPPEEHLKLNITLNVMTAIASLTLAILLYAIFLGRSDTHFIIYVTAGFLTAMFAWQAQVFWRNLKLRKQIVPPNRAANSNLSKELKSAQSRKSLDPADFADAVPANFGAKTTSKLKTEKSS